MNWKDNLKYIISDDTKMIEGFIENLLEEQRKELITQLPDDLKTFVRMSIDNNWQFTEEQVIKAEVAWNKLMENKLEEQRKELSNRTMYQQGRRELVEQILKEAPGDRDNVFVPDHTPSMHGGLICRGCGGQEDCDCETFNQANQQWRDLLTKHLI